MEGWCATITFALCVAWPLWPFLAGFIGQQKGQALTGFLMGLVVGPLGVLLILLSESPWLQCGNCKMWVPRAAKACGHCQAVFSNRA